MKLGYLVVPLIVMVAGYSFAAAQVSEQVTVTATVPSAPPVDEPDTTIIFNGLAYPSSQVTIRQDGSIIATVPADPQAQFNVSAIVDPGIHTYSVFGEDADGRTGRASNFTLSLTKGTITTISGIFLAPTISVTASELSPGDTITVLGITVPQSTVSIFLNTVSATGVHAAAGESVYQVNAGSGGTWSRSFLAADLGVGGYSVKAKAVSPTDAISEFSSTLSFDIGPGDPCDTADPGDLNCDGFVNLVDFSILLYYWQQSNPANARADVNSDGIVDVIDFSVMLYYWTG